jgi:serine/threonine protein kinase
VLPRLVDVLDASYVAPECQGRAQRMTKESDVYAAGVIAFQLLTGELPFTTTVDQHAKGSVLPSSVLERAGVSSDLAAWLQRLCARTPADRPCAADAQAELTRLLGRTSAAGASARDKAQTRDFRNLGDGDMLTAQYTIRRKLGSGTFGVVYQVYDSLADTDYAIKIVDHDRDSLIDRHRQEYRILLGLNKPGHPNVVAVRHASFLDNDTVPYLVFDFLDGPDLKAILREGALTPADALTLGRELAAGLAYLHQRGVYHCDMKPNNVIRTDHGAMIVDFNVSVTADDTMSKVGGNNRYLPPDIPDGSPLDAALLIDRDVYGAGLIVYEALTGSWPYERPSRPVLSEEPADPRKYPALANLSDDFADAVMKAIAPQRGDRYHSADDLAKALQSIGPVRKQPPAPNPAPAAAPGPEPTGVNPFVGYLATLYSQSASTNAGTRGHDPHDVYVATKLDKKLTDDILAGTYRLVIVTGNAGDGKTAFLERLAIRARRNGGIAGPERANGADVTLTNGMLLRTNHDGSQDEGDRANDDVLLDFFTPFADGHPPVMDEVRLIAINEGRLVDFCTSHAGRFDALGRAVRSGLDGEPPSDGIAVVNLNRRSVVAADGLEVSIFERILDTLTDDQNWAACAGCELATSCYARHNALTLAHRSAGPKIAGRLHELFTLAHLRGRLHITLRDTRSALAYMLTSGRDCEQIHRLYEGRDDKSEEILDGFYFTSWAGYPGSPDRLLTELRELDVAQVPDPALDRKLDYVGPDAGQALMSVDGRSDADLRELQTLFKGLPRAPKPSAAQARLHARYLSAARRRFFFECVDEQHARAMLPYRSAMTYLDLLAAPDRAQAYLPDLVAAINRGEGLPDPGRLGDDLALQVRDVPGGTIRSYRLFPKSNLVLSATGADEARYLEVQRDGLLLVHRSETGHEARLPIKLDLFEFLHRLRTGYLPGVAEEQGLLLGLTIFKNELAAAPYQQIVLTTGGDDLHSVERVPDGQLVMRELRERVR